MNVIISDHAFITVVSSCLEVYRKEGFGLLYGERLGEVYSIEHAAPHQAAKRKLSGVWTRNNRMYALRRATLSLCNCEELGDFHSHTQHRGDGADIAPSGYDTKDMRPKRIYLIVAINDTKGFKEWHRQALGTVCGTVDNKDVRIGAYYREKSKVKIGNLTVAPGTLLGVKIYNQFEGIEC